MGRERMPQRMRRRTDRHAERAAQPFHGELNDPRTERATSRADKDRSFLWQWMRAHRTQILDQRATVLQPRPHPGLVAFAGHDQNVTRAGQRYVAALQPE